MSEELLERIVIAIEGINKNLEDLNNTVDGMKESLEELTDVISSCVVADCCGKMIRIGGSIAKI